MAFFCPHWATFWKNPSSQVSSFPPPLPPHCMPFSFFRGNAVRLCVTPPTDWDQESSAVANYSSFKAVSLPWNKSHTHPKKFPQQRGCSAQEIKGRINKVRWVSNVRWIRTGNVTIVVQQSPFVAHLATRWVANSLLSGLWQLVEQLHCRTSTCTLLKQLLRGTVINRTKYC